MLKRILCIILIVLLFPIKVYAVDSSSGLIDYRPTRYGPITTSSSKIKAEIISYRGTVRDYGYDEVYYDSWGNINPVFKGWVLPDTIEKNGSKYFKCSTEKVISHKPREIISEYVFPDERLQDVPVTAFAFIVNGFNSVTPYKMEINGREGMVKKGTTEHSGYSRPKYNPTSKTTEVTIFSQWNQKCISDDQRALRRVPYDPSKFNADVAATWPFYEAPMSRWSSPFLAAGNEQYDNPRVDGSDKLAGLKGDYDKDFTFNINSQGMIDSASYKGESCTFELINSREIPGDGEYHMRPEKGYSIASKGQEAVKNTFFRTYRLSSAEPDVETWVKFKECYNGYYPEEKELEANYIKAADINGSGSFDYTASAVLSKRDMSLGEDLYADITITNTGTNDWVYGFFISDDESYYSNDSDYLENSGYPYEPFKDNNNFSPTYTMYWNNWSDSKRTYLYYSTDPVLSGDSIKFRVKVPTSKDYTSTGYFYKSMKVSLRTKPVEDMYFKDNTGTNYKYGEIAPEKGFGSSFGFTYRLSDDLSIDKFIVDGTTRPDGVLCTNSVGGLKYECETHSGMIVNGSPISPSYNNVKLKHKGDDIISFYSSLNNKEDNSNYSATTINPVVQEEVVGSRPGVRRKVDKTLTNILNTSGKFYNLKTGYTYRRVLGSGLSNGRKAELDFGDFIVDNIPPKINYSLSESYNGWSNYKLKVSDDFSGLRFVTFDYRFSNSDKNYTNVMRPSKYDSDSNKFLLSLDYDYSFSISTDLLSLAIEAEDYSGNITSVTIYPIDGKLTVSAPSEVGVGEPFDATITYNNIGALPIWVNGHGFNLLSKSDDNNSLSGINCGYCTPSYDELPVGKSISYTFKNIKVNKEGLFPITYEFPYSQGYSRSSAYVNVKDSLGVNASITKTKQTDYTYFKQLESGYLDIEYKGNPDKVKVTFPIGMEKFNREIPISSFTNKKYRMEFQVPDGFKDGDYRVNVKVIKDNKEKESNPSFTVKGSVTKDLRTRIRK